MVVARLISLLVGYVCGLFETGYFYGKSKNTDIREHGSGNAGTTNALRTFGIAGGIITLLGDVCKSVIAIISIYAIYHTQYPGAVYLLMMYAGLGAILGHNFPFYLNFRGGKGIACTAGFIIAFCPLMVPVCLVAFVLIVAITRYVSLGSIVVVCLFFIQLVLFGNMGLLHCSARYLNEIYLLGAIIMILAIVRHRNNIVKLKNKTENKISFHKNGKEENHA
ncbi:glycerol-3-phosphate acyltransferase PlsY [Lachnospiraceae bacterium XBB1006]|nr:glycerol-3-phosphate acyltransferase PlsY [Lachnospiraceae bacterium XBB1006]